VIAAIAFPLGAMDSDAKRYETEVAVDHGAHFIEAVANIGRAKDEDYAYIERELRDIVDAADERPVGLIIEAPLLGREELRALCGLAVECGLKSIVTSTGFDGCDAQVEDIRFIREIVGEQFGIKANGGIRDEASALAMIEAGATRVGAAEVTNILKH
jgi:deoxyribose-phosphate aldolase